MNQFITVAAIVVFAVQLLFVVNFFYSIFKGKMMKDRNPWQSTTLEWTTPIKTGHGNWPGKIPTVQRWAYDYSKNGRDFVSQIEPMTEEEKKEEAEH